MTLKAKLQHDGTYTISGLAADTKPLDVPSGSFFWETNTGRIWYYNGSAWVRPTDVVTSAASITDNRIVRGDGGGTGVQESLWDIGDAGRLAPVGTDQDIGAVGSEVRRIYAKHAVGGVDIFNGTGTLDDAKFVVAQAGTYTLTLPAASVGWAYLIERQGLTGTVSLAPGGGDTINGGGTTTLAAASTYWIFAQDATDWRLVKTDSSGFGKDIQSATDTSRTTTTSDVFQDKVSLVTAAVTGTYRVSFEAMIDSNAGSNKDFEVRIYNSTDAVALQAPARLRLNTTSDLYLWSGFAPVVMAGVAKTLIIQFRSPNNTATIGCQEARIQFWRESA